MSSIKPPNHLEQYWQIWTQYLPGGQAEIRLTVFPEQPLNFDEIVERFGMDDTLYPGYAWTLPLITVPHAAAKRLATATQTEAESDSEALSYLVVKTLGEGADWIFLSQFNIQVYFSTEGNAYLYV